MKTPFKQAVVAGLAAGVGVFLLLGGFGHLAAIWPPAEGFTVEFVVLLLPALLLLGIGSFNLLVTRALWLGSARVYSMALGLNGVLMAYLLYLLFSGVPGHPLMTFVAIVGVFIAALAFVRMSSSGAADPATS